MARIVNEQDYAMKRAEILDVAQRLIYTKGYEQMSIQDILDILHISKGAFYHYFDSKQALLEALIERMLEAAIKILTPIVEDPKLPALEKMYQYFNTAAQWKTARKEFMIELLRIWYTDNNALVRQKLYSATVKQVAPAFSEIVRQGIREGIFSPAYPDYVSELIFSLWHNMGDTMAEVFLKPDPQISDLIYVEKAIAAFTDAMERVLGAPSGSIQLVDMALLKEWLSAPGETPTNNGPDGQKAQETV